MKKILFGLFAMAGLVLTSCNMDVKDSTAKDSFQGFYLVSPLDGRAPEACASMFQVDMNVTKATGTVASGVKYNDKPYVFSSNQINVQQDYGANLFRGFQANVNNDPSMALSATNILVTYNFVYPYAQFVDPNNQSNTFTLSRFYPNKENSATGGTPIDGVLYRPDSNLSPVVVGSYVIGQDFKVTAFMTDRTYQGTTGTSYTVMGQPASASSKTIYYRIILDFAEMKAALVMYKAKFSNVEAEPEKAVIYLPDLKLTWGDGSYTVSGTDITPMVIDGGQLEEMPDFKFANFTMHSTGQFMTGAQMNFTVINSMNGMNIEYKGNFTGDSVSIPNTMN